MRGCFARWLSGKTLGKRAVKHGKSGLRTAICALSGTSRGDLCKTVEKLCKSLQGVKTKNTNCAQRFVRLGTRIVQVSFPRCVRCVGVVVRRCAIRSFSLPPAEAGCPFRRRGQGGRRTSAGCCARGRPPLPSPSPTLRTALRPSAGRGSAVGGLTREERTGRGGDCLVHFRLCARHFAHQRAGARS